jgi:uncharacterized protein (TIGR02391 family)
MTDDGWIPFQTATLILGGDGAVRRLKEALILGKVKSRGIVPRSLSADPEEPEVTVEIPGDRWALWVFLPISEVSLSPNRRRLQWLVPSKEVPRLICAGYYNVRLSREDVERERLSEAQRRAEELRADLTTRGVHPDVLRFCRQELLADNYFHAVLEAVKSVADKLRARTALTEDGAQLVDRALTGDPPMLAINLMKTESEKGEQKGFANLLRGTFGMFRNTTAHEARINWPMTKDDAEDLLSLVSLIHRRLDAAQMLRRV